MQQVIINFLDHTELVDIDLASKFEFETSKVSIPKNTFLLLNGRPCPPTFLLRSLDTLSVRLTLMGGGSLFGSSDTTQNTVTRNKMAKSFSTEVNKSVVTSISTNQTFTGGDVVIKGKGNKVNIAQIGQISAKQYVSQLSKVVDNIKTTLVSQLEASAQNDKSAGDSLTVSGGMTPAGPTASGTMGGLVSTASTTTNTTNETEVYLDMASKVSEAIRSDDSIVQMFEIGDIVIEGENNEVDFSQSAAIDKLMQIIQKDEKETTVEDDIVSTNTNKSTMTASGNEVIKYASIAGVLIPLALIYMAFGGGGGGGFQRPYEERKSMAIKSRCGDKPDQKCRGSAIQKFDEGETSKKFMYGFLIFIAVIVIIFILYKLIKYIRELF